jgi:cobalamin biosynthesis protein CobD/CbiB
VARPIAAIGLIVSSLKRDLREFARQTNLRLAVGALILLFVVGLTLIYMMYGAGAALAGLLCLLGGLVPIGLVVAILFGVDWIVKRGNSD